MKKIYSTFKKALFCIIVIASMLIGNEKSFGQTNNDTLTYIPMYDMYQLPIQGMHQQVPVRYDQQRQLFPYVPCLPPVIIQKYFRDSLHYTTVKVGGNNGNDSFVDVFLVPRKIIPLMSVVAVDYMGEDVYVIARVNLVGHWKKIRPKKLNNNIFSYGLVLRQDIEKKKSLQGTLYELPVSVPIGAPGMVR